MLSGYPLGMASRNYLSLCALRTYLESFWPNLAGGHHQFRRQHAQVAPFDSLTSTSIAAPPVNYSSLPCFGCAVTSILLRQCQLVARSPDTLHRRRPVATAELYLKVQNMLAQL